MNIWAPWEVASTETDKTDVLVNIFGGTKRSTVEIRLGEVGEWEPMIYMPQKDPYYKALKARDDTNHLERKLHIALRGNNEATVEGRRRTATKEKTASLRSCKINAHLAS